MSYNMAAIKKKNIELILISSIARPDLFCFGFGLNQSQRTKLIPQNGNG